MNCTHLSTVSTKYPALQWYAINAEELEDLSIQFDIESVPTFIILKSGKEVYRYAGQNAPAVTLLVQKYSHVKDTGITAPPTNTKTQNIETLVKSHPIMVFIKGTPSVPRCKTID